MQFLTSEDQELVLLNQWAGSLQQNVTDVAINEWRKWLRACVPADWQHFEGSVLECGADEA